MARDWQAYQRLLRSLLPRGRAWTPDAGVLKELMQGMAVELSRVDSRVDDLLAERDTRTADELIPEFLREFGLPDECLDTGGMTTDELRAVLNGRLTALGSLRNNYYLGIAAALGYTHVSIEEYRPFWSGIGVSGDPCGDQQNLFHWKIKWTYDAGKPAQDGSDIACLIGKRKPAHTVVAVEMTGPAFSRAFSSAFNSITRLI